MHPSPGLEGTLRDALDKGLRLVLNITRPAEFEPTRAAVAKFRQVAFLFAGLHPNEAQAELERTLAMVRREAASVDGIGEIGLDGATYAPAQLLSFTKQLELAEELGKPVSVHSRGKVGEVLSTLASYGVRSVLLHWFDGSERELEEACGRGYFVSFGPAVLYSRRLARLASRCGEASILTETDAPVRFGACFEGRESSPDLIPSVVFALARIRRCPPLDLEKSVAGNASRFLGGRPERF